MIYERPVEASNIKSNYLHICFFSQDHMEASQQISQGNSSSFLTTSTQPKVSWECFVGVPSGFGFFWNWVSVIISTVSEILRFAHCCVNSFLHCFGHLAFSDLSKFQSWYKSWNFVVIQSFANYVKLQARTLNLAEQLKYVKEWTYMAM